ncbi:protein Aster-B-like [Xiphias gladius]|uniref:protein Aster-B-like n=1 Tax=Xiphias gladius TaxID=8245 RepID=UPI001A9957A6|nr:protein Aster-B-like [Xiphias gladius]
MHCINVRCKLSSGPELQAIHPQGVHEGPLGTEEVFRDVVYHLWRKEHDGNQTREIVYAITLNNPLAPKTATALSHHRIPQPQSTEERARLHGVDRASLQEAVMGACEGFIDRNFWSGLEDYFRHLG